MNADAIDAFSDSARDLLSRNAAVARLRRLSDAQAGFDPTAWQEIANAGWLGVLVSEDDGGLGLGLQEMSAIAQEVGQALFPEPYIAGAVQVATVLTGCPLSVLRSQLLECLVDGSCVAGLARKAWANASCVGTFHAADCAR